jgi:glycosyltransferase involved in cell wall biosynthesis
MRVAFISFAFMEYSIRWANALTAHADVLLTLPGTHEPLFPEPDPHLQLLLLPQARMRQIWRQLRGMWILWRALQRFQPDVIHLQQGFIWFNLLLPFLFRQPLIITIHDPKPHLGDREQKQPQAIFRFGFRRARRWIVHGEALRDLCVRELGLPPERIAVIPHIRLGEDIEAPPAAAEPVILFFGRIWAYKGLDSLIRAEPMIAAAVPDVKIMIAGTGADLEQYRRLMTDPSRYIIHNAFIPNEAIANIFMQAAVVALPYREATQSGVIPLACTYARPVVATRVGALPDAVEDGVTGLLVPPGDDEALAKALIRLLREPELARRMGIAARLKIDREAAPDVVAQMSMEVYRSAARG